MRGAGAHPLRLVRAVSAPACPLSLAALMSFARTELAARRGARAAIGKPLAFAWGNTAPAVTAAPRTTQRRPTEPRGVVPQKWFRAANVGGAQ